jgi:hypothetical protein
MANTSTIVQVRVQLKDVFKQVNINDSGGVVFVAKAGLPEKATLQDLNGNSIANPIVLTSGSIDFAYDSAITATVDLYGHTAAGHWFEYKSVSPSGPNEINVDTARKRGRMKIPFSYVDCTPGTEYKTGFLLPALGFILNRLHGCGLDVTTKESGKTLSVGILSTENGGAATGFINASSVATAGQVIGTDGALFSTNAPYATDTQTASSPNGLDISYTLSSGAAAAEGFILLPYVMT